MLTIIACESPRIVDTADRGMDKLEDNKFAHLLQPIRDLAANWDINIANELEDYLVRNEVPGKMQVSLRFHTQAWLPAGCAGKCHLFF